MLNERDTYSIVDTKDKVIEKFRVKATAIYILELLQKNHLDKLKIIKNG